MMITYRVATPNDAVAMGVARETGQWTGGAGATTMARYLAGEHHPQHAQASRVAPALRCLLFSGAPDRTFPGAAP